MERNFHNWHTDQIPQKIHIPGTLFADCNRQKVSSKVGRIIRKEQVASWRHAQQALSSHGKVKTCLRASQEMQDIFRNSFVRHTLDKHLHHVVGHREAQATYARKPMRFARDHGSVAGLRSCRGEFRRHCATIEKVRSGSYVCDGGASSFHDWELLVSRSCGL